MQSAAQIFDPARQTRAESDLAFRVGMVLDRLERAARGDNPAYEMSSAMASVDSATRGGPISIEQRDELLSVAGRAHLGAIRHLPEPYSREQIAVGMKALAGQVTMWAETRERSAQRPSHVRADINAYARMFRNDLHNISLVEEIDRRAWERREQHIQPLRNRG
jgi:hypothetical protein